MQPTKFTIRVYGILINDKSEVLLADEVVNGRHITKFPGGGLEFGEGPADCVVREFREETGQEVSVLEHYYTTDFYIHSQINPEFQVVAIYYRVSCATTEQILIGKSTDNITLKWVSLFALDEEDVTFESDKTVVRMLSLPSRA
ncbi:MAG: NUDIX hydrolase [Bacteroidia bacterium]